MGALSRNRSFRVLLSPNIAKILTRKNIYHFMDNTYIVIISGIYYVYLFIL